MIREPQDCATDLHNATIAVGRPVPAVFVMEPNARRCEDLQRLIQGLGFNVLFCATLEDLSLCYYPSVPTCLLIDARTGVLSPVDILEQFAASNFKIPVLVLIDHPDAKLVQGAFRRGATDVFIAPALSQELAAAIQNAVDQDAAVCATRCHQYAMSQALKALSSGERAVLDWVCEGLPNKVIASRLGISQRAVEDRRAKVMRKLNAESIVDLVRSVLESRTAELGR